PSGATTTFMKLAPVSPIVCECFPVAASQVANRPLPVTVPIHEPSGATTNDRAHLLSWFSTATGSTLIGCGVSSTSRTFFQPTVSKPCTVAVFSDAKTWNAVLPSEVVSVATWDNFDSNRAAFFSAPSATCHCRRNWSPPESTVLSSGANARVYCWYVLLPPWRSRRVPRRATAPSGRGSSERAGWAATAGGGWAGFPRRFGTAPGEAIPPAVRIAVAMRPIPTHSLSFVSASIFTPPRTIALTGSDAGPPRTAASVASRSAAGSAASATDG